MTRTFVYLVSVAQSWIFEAPRHWTGWKHLWIKPSGFFCCKNDCAGAVVIDEEILQRIGNELDLFCPILELISSNSQGCWFSSFCFRNFQIVVSICDRVFHSIIFIFYQDQIFQLQNRNACSYLLKNKRNRSQNKLWSDESMRKMIHCLIKKTFIRSLLPTYLLFTEDIHWHSIDFISYAGNCLLLLSFKKHSHQLNCQCRQKNSFSLS